MPLDPLATKGPTMEDQINLVGNYILNSKSDFPMKDIVKVLNAWNALTDLALSNANELAELRKAQAEEKANEREAKP